MRTYSFIAREHDPRGVLTLTLNRPEKRNALNAELLEELLQALGEAENNPDLKLLVITGRGEVFCAGGDLREFLDPDPYRLGAQTERVRDLFLRLFLFPLPTLARVNGLCLAGGLGIALACDLIVASDDSEFGAPEIHVELFPFMLSVFMLRNFPEKLAFELVYTGRRLSAQDAHSIGVVNRIVPRAHLDECTATLTESILKHSPELLRAGKSAFVRQYRLGAASSLFGLREDFYNLLLRSETQQGLHQFFSRSTPTPAKE